jgi:hypothetical protein
MWMKGFANEQAKCKGKKLLQINLPRILIRVLKIKKNLMTKLIRD